MLILLVNSISGDVDSVGYCRLVSYPPKSFKSLIMCKDEARRLLTTNDFVCRGRKRISQVDGNSLCCSILGLFSVPSAREPPWQFLKSVLRRLINSDLTLIKSMSTTCYILIRLFRASVQSLTPMGKLANGMIQAVAKSNQPL